MAASHKDVLRRLEEMEGKVDRQFRVVFDAIRALMEPPAKPGRRIGPRLRIYQGLTLNVGARIRSDEMGGEY